MNLASIVVTASLQHGDKPALRFYDECLPYNQFAQQVGRGLALLQSHGVGAGDRVVLVALNRPEWVVAMSAVLAAGAIVVPVNPALTRNEISYIVGHCKPALVIVDGKLVESVGDFDRQRMLLLDGEGEEDWKQASANRDPHSAFVKRAAQDPAAIFYTSGTTGRPKGVLLSHAALAAVSEVTQENFAITAADSSLIPNSLSFIYPLMINCLTCLRAGATVWLQDRFHPEQVMRAIERERISIFMGVPTMFNMMLNWAEGKAVDASSLRFCVSAGSSLAWKVVQNFREKLGVTVYDLWGQTEGTPITSYCPVTEKQGRPESCGRALPGCAVRVVDDAGQDLAPGEVGEVLLTGPNVMLGYYLNPEATASTLKEGWVYTGDLGRLDADGYLYIVGRKRDMIIRGGANIYPVEIEDVLYTHPDVLECAVVGVPDELYGEAVKACVVTRSGRPLTLVALQQHCRANLADYKLPTQIECLAELPKGPTGKILKRLLTGAPNP